MYGGSIMANAELNHIGTLLEKAHAPEEIFGDLQGTPPEKLTSARKIFLHIAKVVHPDAHPGAEEAEQAHVAFKKLNILWEQAQARISSGTYGLKDAAEAFVPFTIQTATGQYTLERLLIRGDLCNLYVGTTIGVAGKKQILLKVPIHPQDNDLVANEARILRHLHAGKNAQAAHHFVSQLVDAFSYEEHATGILRRLTVLSYVEGLFSLKEVRQAYPRGLDARDMAWIWRRVLIALDFAHTNNVIHGSVLPPHILIHPEQHGVVLIDWSYAVLDPASTHTWVSAISSDYRAWYPAEVFARQEPQPGLDISMAGRCMIDLLGGDPQQRSMPDSVPWQIQSHLQGCTLPHPHQRPQDARILLQAFDELLERLWGRRTFHAFSMPGR
jgi:serine/threonine protein kinase